MASIDELNDTLFEAIREVQRDPKYIEKAKTIANLGKVMVEGYKVKCQALDILSRADNPKAVKEVIESSGITSNAQPALE